MLQNVLRKLLSNKLSKSSMDIKIYIKTSPEVSLNKWKSHEMIHQTSDDDDDDIILRKHKSTNKEKSHNNHRKRIVSCPDATDLQLMYKTVDIALVDLKRICEEGSGKYE